ncbi:dnaJ domain-containing protein [Ditylenchus destructor]|uniref:DnaJ domain-containing protein n=1 Tax=Ditylenchus destructor TaxID=166010 RepID=A0AAD4MFC4_9BILA|nr:dnaJ domain-containing protein [Ditylenchus destructor]
MLVRRYSDGQGAARLCDERGLDAARIDGWARTGAAKTDSGCEEPGDRPAPKSPNSPERWYFCETHAAEYNRNWNYFEGLTAEEAAKREADERRTADGFTASRHNAWAGPATAVVRATRCVHSTCSSSIPFADFEGIRAAWRRLARINHPDIRPGDTEAAKRFQAIQGGRRSGLCQMLEEAGRRVRAEAQTAAGQGAAQASGPQKGPQGGGRGRRCQMPGRVSRAAR